MFTVSGLRVCEDTGFCRSLPCCVDGHIWLVSHELGIYYMVINDMENVTHGNWAMQGLVSGSGQFLGLKAAPIPRLCPLGFLTNS